MKIREAKLEGAVKSLIKPTVDYESIIARLSPAVCDAGVKLLELYANETVCHTRVVFEIPVAMIDFELDMHPDAVYARHYQPE